LQQKYLAHLSSAAAAAAAAEEQEEQEDAAAPDETDLDSLDEPGRAADYQVLYCTVVSSRCSRYIHSSVITPVVPLTVSNLAKTPTDCQISRAAR